MPQPIFPNLDIHYASVMALENCACSINAFFESRLLGCWLHPILFITLDSSSETHRFKSPGGWQRLADDSSER